MNKEKHLEIVYLMQCCIKLSLDLTEVRLRYAMLSKVGYELDLIKLD